MNDPIVSFDTLTIGAELDALGAHPAQAAKVLARLPRVTPPRPKTINRVDEAESPIPTAHLADAISLEGEAPTAIAAETTGDFFTTIRIDTVTPDRVAEPERTRKPTPQPQPIAAPAMRVVHAPEEGDTEPELASLLLNLEAAILPYSRWIALAAVIAALGLTLVLLRSGGSAEAVDGVAPQVSFEPNQEALAEAEAFNPGWLAPVSPAAPTAPVTTVAQTQPAATATGPASLPTPPGHAELTNEVRVPTAQRVNVADNRSAESYPRTTR